MNSIQLHYREAVRALNADDLPTATVHALLANTIALTEATEHAAPVLAPEAIAEAVGVLATPDNVIHHAFNAFGSTT